MTFDIQKWLSVIKSKLLKEFPNRICFIGIQGSYGRGEATDKSDIDVVVILDSINIEDLKTYRNIINSMPNNEKACGFICGTQELKNWSHDELFTLHRDTISIFGDLQNFLPDFTPQDVETAVKRGAEQIYHTAIHNFLYDNNSALVLKELYKSVFFIIRNKYYLETGLYSQSLNELINKVSFAEKTILEISKTKDKIINFNNQEREIAFTNLTNYCKILINTNLTA